MKVEIYVAAAWVNLNALDATDYVESAGISLGGAKKTPNPVAGTCHLTLLNENGIFHKDHPTSPYKDYCKTGRPMRISVGARYAGADYYWQRILGYMDEPKFGLPDYRVEISGGDHMKPLRETELRNPYNYWGTTATFDSFSSDGLAGSEIYAEGDAMEIGGGEANNVANWVATNCTFVSFADGGGGSTYVGRLTTTGVAVNDVRNTNVGSATAGNVYKLQFKHQYVGEDGTKGIYVQIFQTSGRCKAQWFYPDDNWVTVDVYFTALDTGAIDVKINGPYADAADYRLDQISVFEFIPYRNRYYELPGASKGAYHVTLDGNDVWQGKMDDGWFEEESTRRVFFDLNKTVAAGTDNVIVSYLTTESPENMVADLLVRAALYADRAAALAAMDYTATGITINKPWFEPGTTCLDAIKKLCERCDYRFYFSYDGTPIFKPKPSPGAVSFTFTDPKHIISASTYQDRSEIKNRIVIKGMRQAEPVNKEEAMPPELKGEAYDQTSIDTYGERTLPINNHLFQDQTAIDNMCTSLLAEYKDPKWYTDLELEFNPVPIEMGDKIQWPERLSPNLAVTKTGVVRDIKITDFNVIYVCEND
jgi:hypothetical protein